LKKFLITSLAAVLALGMVGGAFAIFQDTETSSGNTFTAGTLDLGPGPAYYVQYQAGYYAPYHSPVVELTPGGNGVNGKVVFSDIKPGDSGKIFWSIKNVGSIPGSLDVYITRSVDSDNGINEPEDMVDGVLNGSDGTADGDLDDWSHIQLLADLDGNGTWETVMQNGTGMGELETYLPIVGNTYEKLSNKNMNPGDVINFQFAWRIDPDIGIDGSGHFVNVNDNIIQSDQVVLDLSFELLQNPD
jgi:predicted ribosomally synthesized peptide with SipW-like signal peptide